MDDIETEHAEIEAGVVSKDETPTPPLPPTTEPCPAGRASPAGATCPAGFVRRALAFVMDFIFLNFLYGILALFGLLGSYLSKGEVSSFSSLIAPFVSIWFVLFIGYFTFFHAHSGQTPAKQIIRIKVVNKEGVNLSHWTALFRSFLSLFSLLFFSMGFLFAAFGKKRGAHDMLARSYVVLS